ncbi:MAG: PD40 domain-containing protein [Gloeobacteraceae cyanobacterium ES-bin-316]|nr:PD40 domain-containing protein [Ferruginibacter sp.]
MNVKIIWMLFVQSISGTVFSQATIFEPVTISNDKVFGASLSPNGKQIFFVNAFGGRDTLQIMESKKIKGKWQKPTPAFFADARYKEIDPTVSPDGETILFNSNEGDGKTFDIYALYKTASGWTNPEKLSSAVNSSGSDFFATMSSNRNIYFTRRIESNDIYVSYFLNNQYQNAVPLDSTINSAKNESNPYIAPDESYLIFFSDQEGGFGDSDLYISFRNNNKWSRPLNLGGKVNTALSEFCPAVDVKGGYFYFSRTTVIGNTRKENIYRIKLKELGLKKLRRSAMLPN